MSSITDPVVEVPRSLGWTMLVGVLAVSLAFFLVKTMGIREKEASLIAECQDRLMAVSSAQQSHLVANGKYADTFIQLVPFMDDRHHRMPYLCPITGERLEMLVQLEQYIVLAPHTPYSVKTGDSSW